MLLLKTHTENRPSFGTGRVQSGDLRAAHIAAVPAAPGANEHHNENGLAAMRTGDQAMVSSIAVC